VKELVVAKTVEKRLKIACMHACVLIWQWLYAKTKIFCNNTAHLKKLRVNGERVSDYALLAVRKKLFARVVLTVSIA
jgi:hypothetical protein